MFFVMFWYFRGYFVSFLLSGDAVTLNASDLLSQAKEEQEKLREELKTVLDELTYNKLAQTESEIVEASKKTLTSVPHGVYVG